MSSPLIRLSFFQYAKSASRLLKNAYGHKYRSIIWPREFAEDFVYLWTFAFGVGEHLGSRLGTKISLLVAPWLDYTTYLCLLSAERTPPPFISRMEYFHSTIVRLDFIADLAEGFPKGLIFRRFNKQSWRSSTPSSHYFFFWCFNVRVRFHSLFFRLPLFAFLFYAIEITWMKSASGAHYSFFPSSLCDELSAFHLRRPDRQVRLLLLFTYLLLLYTSAYRRKCDPSVSPAPSARFSRFYYGFLGWKLQTACAS